MRFIFIFLLINSTPLWAQVDTVVVADLTEIMVTVRADGSVEAATDFSRINEAGFFLDQSINGSVEICNDEKVDLWVNGRLHDVFYGCKYFEVSQLQENGEESTYISIYSAEGIQNLSCKNVVFEPLQIVRDVSGNPRLERDIYNEFVIIALVSIIFFCGYIVTVNPGRRNYLIRKTFSLKQSSYEFVNTSFFTQSNLQFLFLLSITVGFLFSSASFLKGFDQEETVTPLILYWLRVSGLIFILIFTKWILASLISLLFRIKKINDHQLFDFENFLLISFSLVTTLLVGGFIIYEPLQILIYNRMNLIVVLILVAFLIWFGLKFVNNSPRKKLQIISYLCATEIIPSVLFYLGILK